jgi:polysaccharide deacetylase family protein (PEP-CTERM system associated)
MRVLTFDIEDWFHLLDNNSTKGPEEWSKYPSRVEGSTEKILDLLAEKQIKATFFCLGWIAIKYPGLIRKIHSAGHEIGSHSHMHQLVYEQTKKEFKEDLDQSIQTLEDIIGEKVSCFRAPGFSIKEENKWAFEVLYEIGIRSDCSVFPAARSHGGYKTITYSSPFRLKCNGVILREFPINTKSVLGQRFIYSGGGYFRLLPYNMIKRFTEQSNYVMTYFHPRDFDAGQPMLDSLSAFRKIKSYYGLRSSFNKFRNYLDDFSFIDLQTASEVIDWEKTPLISI